MASVAVYTVEETGFEQVTPGELDGMDAATLDALPFGVIGFDPAGLVDRYNATESRLAGLAPERVVGRHFFDAVAQCMNNYLIAQRFEDEPALDAVVPYVLTLRMRPTPVRLRLLQEIGRPRRYVLVER
jgi:photoactive yellow protein